VVLTFQSVDEILKCDCPNESYGIVRKPVYLPVMLLGVLFKVCERA